jgi:nucleoside-diphosphate-sugar epimerase
LFVFLETVVMQVAIVGYGAVGRETARILGARGDRVIVAQRKPPKSLPAGAQFVAADVLDLDSLRRACAGCAAVICCLGFPYDSRIWEQAWPRAIENFLAVCGESGARFVFADNLYLYGPRDRAPTEDRPLTEDMPLTDFGRKPKLRARITRTWIAAHQAGRVEAVAVRASDFYGPDVETSVLSNYVVKPLARGKLAMIPCSPDHPHDFTYVPDFARALATLLDAPSDACGQAWHAPNAPTQTLRALAGRAAEKMGVAAKLIVLPQAALHLLGLFDRQIYELIEMRFQTARPYFVDSSKFTRRFGWEATPFEAGLDATIGFYRAG